MKYISLFSGIEAASAAWHPAGFTPIAFSEIEKFPCDVLKHHYPHVPNYGDVTKFKDWPDATADIIIGGSPCQSFSVAGLRKGLDDPRGNLMLTYLAVADRYRPEWLVWENVPGVLSSSGGRDFGTFLCGLAKLGYGFAYRILDAQYFGVAQRRRRVFVVANSRSWRRAAAVLFERHSLQGNSPPRRETGQRFAADLAPSLVSSGRGVERIGETRGHDPVIAMIAVPHAEICPALKARDCKGPNSDGDGDGAILIPMTTHTLRGVGFDASEDGTGRGTPLIPVAYRTAGDGAAYCEGDKTAPLTTGTDPSANIIAGTMAYGLDEEQNAAENLMGTLKARMSGGGFEGAVMTPNMSVRRLTPRECERLQGFPDDYTDIYTSRKKGTPDSSRYKALGNSMAVPVIRWIGERIQQVSAL